MGLAQTFHFEFEKEAQLEEFIDDLSQGYDCTRSQTSWVIAGDKMMFEVFIVEGGFYVHRSGNYFGFLGLFVEKLTGKFGKVVIEDV